MEHPVTEWIAEINLPAAQVAVGMGIPLWQIPGIILVSGFLQICFDLLVIFLNLFTFSVYMIHLIRNKAILWNGTWWWI